MLISQILQAMKEEKKEIKKMKSNTLKKEGSLLQILAKQQNLS
jgi:hypothetical protein